MFVESVDFALVLTMLLPRDFDVSQLFEGEHQLDKGLDKDGMQVVYMRDKQTIKVNGLKLEVKPEVEVLLVSEPVPIFSLSVFLQGMWLAG